MFIYNSLSKLIAEKVKTGENMIEEVSRPRDFCLRDLNYSSDLGHFTATYVAVTCP